jgi:hypothetical protein
MAGCCASQRSFSLSASLLSVPRMIYSFTDLSFVVVRTMQRRDQGIIHFGGQARLLTSFDRVSGPTPNRRGSVTIKGAGVAGSSKVELRTVSL